jgi:hypothetical protein
MSTVLTTAPLTIPAILSAGTVAVTATTGSGLVVNGFVRINDGFSEIVGLLTAVSTNSITLDNLIQTVGTGTVLASGALASVGANPGVSFVPLPVVLGGSGSDVGTFVDLTSVQTIAGVKTFSSPPVASGASLTAASVPATALATVTIAKGGTGQVTAAAALAALGVSAGAAESQTIGSNVIKRGTLVSVPVDGSAPTPLAFGTAFPTAVDNIQLTVRSHTSATLKIIAVYPIGAAITTAGFDIEGFGGDASSTASVDWLVIGH